MNIGDYHYEMRIAMEHLKRAVTGVVGSRSSMKGNEEFKKEVEGHMKELKALSEQLKNQAVPYL